MARERDRRPRRPPRPPEPCRHCEAPVIFALDEETGSWLCLNPEPDSELGNVWVRVHRTGKRTAVVLEEDRAQERREAGLALHRQHHRACPGSSRVADRAAGADA